MRIGYKEACCLSRSGRKCSKIRISNIAQLVEAEILSEKPTVTYDFYQKNIKPKPQSTNKNGWRCKICGFIYKEEILPPDFICPVCKHGAVDFEKI